MKKTREVEAKWKKKQVCIIVYMFKADNIRLFVEMG